MSAVPVGNIQAAQIGADPSVEPIVKNEAREKAMKERAAHTTIDQPKQYLTRALLEPGRSA